MARPRKDERLHVLQNTQPEWTDTPVVYRGGRPKRPKDLSAVEKPVWDEMCRLLEKRQSLTPGDGPLLRTYCAVHVRWRALCKEIDDRGVMVEDTFMTKSGEEYTRRVPNPALKLAAQLETQLRLLYKELCSTPASRARVRPTTPAPKNKGGDGGNGGPAPAGNALVF